ncbi:hypothetical protein ROZALSC1DRAFT_28942 [Rozella allomycis CSF55]|uniref:Uncharacterized protein n=1 Tax=Rozella allomycis (strain CSF55) TaxID=988480 RepID=A0A4P9YLR3_ROZAC|nr:hypothetical protein ROZALSC1DRAFT_28942 [Rozella allomycis CSF55]
MASNPFKIAKPKADARLNDNPLRPSNKINIPTTQEAKVDIPGNIFKRKRDLKEDIFKTSRNKSLPLKGSTHPVQNWENEYPHDDYSIKDSCTFMFQKDMSEAERDFKFCYYEFPGTSLPPSQAKLLAKKNSFESAYRKWKDNELKFFYLFYGDRYSFLFDEHKNVKIGDYDHSLIVQLTNEDKPEEHVNDENQAIEEEKDLLMNSFHSRTLKFKRHTTTPLTEAKARGTKLPCLIISMKSRIHLLFDYLVNRKDYVLIPKLPVLISNEPFHFATVKPVKVTRVVHIERVQNSQNQNMQNYFPHKIILTNNILYPTLKIIYEKLQEWKIPYRAILNSKRISLKLTEKAISSIEYNGEKYKKLLENK